MPKQAVFILRQGPDSLGHSKLIQISAIQGRHTLKSHTHKQVMGQFSLNADLE